MTTPSSSQVRARHQSLRQSIVEAHRPPVTRYQDHFSLQAPTSVVRFADQNSTARVIYLEDAGGKQVVIEEHRDEKQKRHITIKQMREEAGGGLRFLRLTYSLAAAFAMGFLFVFSVQVLLLVIFDLAVFLGYTDVDTNTSSVAHRNVLAVGVFFALPVLIHGLALMMMLAGFFVSDLYQGHYFFKKFLLPNMISDQVVEWIFLLGMLVAPLLVFAVNLFLQHELWWEVTSFYWTMTTLAYYLVFMLSVLFFEARVYFQLIQDKNLIRDYDQSTAWGMILSCVAIRKRNALSGYSRTSYASFGLLSADLVHQDKYNHNNIIPGTLKANKRSLYTRFTQWDCCGLYRNLPSPKRIYSVDDVTGRRPYVTTVTWGLEKLFCRPRKSRYVSLLSGPFSITASHMLGSILCSFLGVALTYTILAAVLVYYGFGVTQTFVGLLLALVLSVPCWRTPIQQYWEFRKLRVLQEEFQKKDRNPPQELSPVEEEEPEAPKKEEEENNNDRPPLQVSIAKGSFRNNNSPNENNDEEAALSSSDAEEVEVSFEGNGEVAQQEMPKEEPSASPKDIRQLAVAKPNSSTTTSNDSLSWRGFDDSSGGISGGVYHVSEKYRVTQPTKLLRVMVFVLELIFCFAWPTFSLYWVESWQLATIFVALALLCTLRHYTNAEVLIEEIGQDFICPKEEQEGEDDDNDIPHSKQAWLNQSRLGQVAGTISRGKVYQAWRGVFWFFALAFLFLFVQSQFTSLQSTDDTTATFVRDFEYKPQNSLHYSTCEFTKNIEGNPSATMLDYNMFVLLSYRTDRATQEFLNGWYGPGVIEVRKDVVTAFREKEENPSAVYYKLFVFKENDKAHAIVSIRGSQNAWDWFTNAQLWGSAFLLQMVRAVLPFGGMWNSILGKMNDLLTVLQSGTLDRIAFYKSPAAFVEHLKASGNYSSVVITGHSLGGGLAIIAGAQTHTQAYGISAPNAMISRGRFGITAEELETYAFNVIPDRDLVPMIDDPSKNHQAIECTAPKNSLFGCHSNRRSFCTTLIACGSMGHPVACECATIYGEPEPTPLSGANRTFEEACGHTRLTTSG